MPVPVRLQLRWYWSGEKETVFSSFFLTASCCCENTRDRGCGARSFDYQWEFSWVLQCLRSEFNTCWNLSNKFSEQLKLCTRYWSEWRDRRRGSIRTINNDIDVVNIILIDQILKLYDAVPVFSLEIWIVADFHRHPSGCMFVFSEIRI